MNCAVLEYGEDLLVIDCGVNFPDIDAYGIDVIVPDFTWLEDNAERIVGVVITHGHQDHIGAVPYLLALIDVPVYAPRYAAALIRHILTEHELLDDSELVVYRDGSVLRLGCFTVHVHPVNHSIPDTFALEIETPIGRIVHSADFKIEREGWIEPAFDFERFRAIGDRGVRALFIDSTNVERGGWTRTEAETARSLHTAIADAPRAVFVTLFSTNVFRMQACVDAAVATGRRLLLLGRSLQRNFECAIDADLIRFPKGSPLVDEREARDLPREQLVILCTGSQGQVRAALPRMARRDFSFTIEAGDTVVFSARAIPGNERDIGTLLDNLARLGATIVTADQGVHCSGHACAEELATLMQLIRPQDLIPVHGDYRFLVRQAALAREVGVPNPLVAENGDCVEFTATSTSITGRRAAPRTLVDQDGPFGAEDGLGHRQRKRYASRGLCVVWMVVSAHRDLICDGPHVLDRGGIDDESLNNGLLATLEGQVRGTWEGLEKHHRGDADRVREAVLRTVKRLIRQETGRRPFVEVFVSVV